MCHFYCVLRKLQLNYGQLHIHWMYINSYLHSPLPISATRFKQILGFFYFGFQIADHKCSDKKIHLSPFTSRHFTHSIDQHQTHLNFPMPIPSWLEVNISISRYWVTIFCTVPCSLRFGLFKQFLRDWCFSIWFTTSLQIIATRYWTKFHVSVSLPKPGLTNSKIEF